MATREFREAIDACHHQDEFTDPEIAEAIGEEADALSTFLRSQAFDHAVARAMDDVPVPTDLADRILAGLQTAESSGSEPVRHGFAGHAVAEDLDDADETAESPAAPVSRRSRGTVARFLRRRSMAMAAGIAAALLIALAVRWGDSRSFELDESISEQVAAWNEQLDVASWSDDFSDAIVVAKPLDPAIQMRTWQWATVRTDYDAQTLVYDLTPVRQQAVFVYCFKVSGRSSNVPVIPPQVPFSTTRGVALGVWQNDGLTYILSIDGDHQRYQQIYRTFIQPQTNLAKTGRGSSAFCLISKI